MIRTHLPLALLLCSVAPVLNAAESRDAVRTVGLSSLDISAATTGWGKIEKNTACAGGKKIAIGGVVFDHGLGVHARSEMHIALDGKAARFRAVCGVDDSANGKGSVVFRVYADGRRLFRSPVMRGGMKGETIDVDVAGVRTLILLATDNDDGITEDRADWADAVLVMNPGAQPVVIPIPSEKAEILTPAPAPAPRINGPKVYGARPGNPFLYRVPCTGTRPIVFSAKGLPGGLELDAGTGIITGTTPAKGEYVVTLGAKNAAGAAERVFKIVAGDTLSLTPQMGWNSWYSYFFRVTDKDMRRAADLLVSGGMADAGYQFVNVDDCWYKAPRRSAWYGPGRFGKMRDDKGNIIPNDDFPDMKGMADYIHAKGLKAGIYLSPGTATCTGAVGSLGHYERDAKQIADWGYDFLKFDSYIGICGEHAPVETLKKPFREMGDILKRQKRDIVFNLCQYGWGQSWKWGKEVGGNSWRTAGDLGFELHRILDIALKNAAIGDFGGPGGWNDPDYLQIGWVASQVGSHLGEPHPSALTPSEQYSFMSLWCLLPAPLFYGGDITHLDAFTLNILCNPEVIEVNQDPLGKPGKVVAEADDTFLMVKELEGGALAVGLCNKDEVKRTVTVRRKDLGVSGKYMLRDLWRQKDLGEFGETFTAEVPRHGVFLVRLNPVR